MNHAEFGYLLAFITGIFGALHCLGMCGSFAAGYFLGHGWKQKFVPQISYHSARISIYILLGVIGAVAGQVIVQTGIVGKTQGIMMIAAGIAIIILGIGLSGGLPWWPKKRCENNEFPLRRIENHKKPSQILPAIAGMLNGFVPCSLVFSVAIKAAATADPIKSGLLMLCFGLGTLPTMALVTVSGAAISTSITGIAEKLIGPVVMLLGAWTLYEGLIFYDIMRGLAS